MISVYKPYWIILIIVIMADVLFKDKSYKSIDIVIAFLGGDTITKTWYVTSILILYMFFYISHHFFTKYSQVCLGVLILIYILTCLIFKAGSFYSASVSCFYLGTLWNIYEDRLVLWIRNKWIIKVSGVAFLFLGFFNGRLVLAAMGYDNVVLQCVLRNIISVSFVFCVIILLQKVELKSSFFELVGEYAYELYIIHYVILARIKSINNMSALGVLAISVCLAFLVNYICKNRGMFLFMINKRSV